MTDEERDPQLQAWFARTHADLTAEPFAADVEAEVERQWRRRSVRRALITLPLLALSLLAAVLLLQKYALQVALMPIATVVQIDNALLAQTLAPVNTVGGILVLVLLIMHAAYRKLFT